MSPNQTLSVPEVFDGDSEYLDFPGRDIEQQRSPLLTSDLAIDDTCPYLHRKSRLNFQDADARNSDLSTLLGEDGAHFWCPRLRVIKLNEGAGVEEVSRQSVVPAFADHIL